MKKITVVLVLSILSILCADKIYAWEVPVFSTNGYNCSKNQSGLVDCHVKIDEIPGGVLFRSNGFKVVTMVIFLPANGGKKNDTFLHYSSASGCLQRQELTKKGKIIKITATDRNMLSKTFKSGNRADDFCMRGLGY